MTGYEIDWVGAAGAGASAIVAFLIAKGIYRGASATVFYVIFGVLTFALALGLRTLLRTMGI